MECLRNLNSPFIVDYVDSFEDVAMKDFCILLEYCEVCYEAKQSANKSVFYLNFKSLYKQINLFLSRLVI